MSLRFRLFLILGALVAALVGAHGWLVRSLAGELAAELDVVALDVGASVARALSGEPPPPCAVPPCPELPPGVRVFHFSDHKLTVGEPKSGERVVVRHIVRRGTAGYAYQIGSPAEDDESGGEPAAPGAPTEEKLVLRLGDGAHAALQLHGPGVSAEVPIPRLGLEEKLAEFQRRTRIGSLLLLLAGLLAAAYLAHRVSSPLQRLASAAATVGDGAWGATVDERAGASELRQALAAFNRMSFRLRELSQQNQRLEQERHLGEIGEIARGLAHSLRNPLHALGLSVDEIAARATAGPAGEEASLAASARRQIRRLDRAIRSFLVFASQSDVEATPVDLASLAEDVALEALQDQHQGIKIEVLAEGEPGPSPPCPPLPADGERGEDPIREGLRPSVSLSPGGPGIRCFVPEEGPLSGEPEGRSPSDNWITPPSVRGEGGRGERSESCPPAAGPLEIAAVEQELRAMVQALVVNAVEASPPGGRVVVRVGSGAAGRLWLEVLDRGGGVAAEVRERLFTPHVTTKASGSGMGLFLAQRLAASRYDGGIELSARDGGGTCARLEILPRSAGGGP